MQNQHECLSLALPKSPPRPAAVSLYLRLTPTTEAQKLFLVVQINCILKSLSPCKL